MTDRETIIRALCEERGAWGDGTPATDESITHAARQPSDYDIDETVLDAACAGDVGAVVTLRQAWCLPALR